MKQYILSPEAKKDLWDIHDYIAEDSPNTAIRFIKLLKDNCTLIASTPKIGRERDELEKGLRSFPFGNYVIFYIIFSSCVGIARILHGSRDMTEIF